MRFSALASCEAFPAGTIDVRPHSRQLSQGRFCKRTERVVNMDTLDHDQFQARRQSPGSWIGRALLVLLFWLAIFYYASPLLSATRLAKAAENHDTRRVAASIDFPALRKSIARQVVAEITRTAPAEQRSAVASYGMMPAVAWLNDLLTEENVTDFLSGKLPVTLGEAPESLASLPPLSARTLSRLLDIWQASGFVTLAEYRLVIPPAPGAGETALQFAISDYSWKLSGVELPEAVLQAAVQRWRAAESRS